MSRRALLGGLAAVLLLGGCEATPEQQRAAIGAGESAVSVRERQSRRFDTTDRALMLQSTVGALQDLGFTIAESEASVGIVSARKIADAEYRAQVSVRALPDGAGMIVRATFQQVYHRPGAMLPIGQELNDPALYQQFFERVAQSAFLTAHEI